MHDLKTAIRAALAGSSSQQPVDTQQLYQLGQRKRVQAALMDMYAAREVSCCLITTRGVSRSVWWSVDTLRALPKYGKTPLAQIRSGNAL
jgi:hypothetical protein